MLNVAFRLRWTDNRLAHRCKNSTAPRYFFGPNDLKDIWSPEISIVTGLSKLQENLPQFFFNNPENGEILLAQGIYMTIPCQFNLLKFPFDPVIIFQSPAILFN